MSSWCSLWLEEHPIMRKCHVGNRPKIWHKHVDFSLQVQFLPVEPVKVVSHWMWHCTLCRLGELSHDNSRNSSGYLGKDTLTTPLKFNIDILDTQQIAVLKGDTFFKPWYLLNMFSWRWKLDYILSSTIKQPTTFFHIQIVSWNSRENFQGPLRAEKKKSQGTKTTSNSCWNAPPILLKELKGQYYWEFLHKKRATDFVFTIFSLEERR